MNGQEAVIQKIISDYSAIAEKVVNDAENASIMLIEKVNAQSNELYVDAEKSAELMKKNIMRKKLALADSECKKIMSAAKKSVIDDAFAEAKNEILELKPEQYKKLISAMIMSAAADGDTVVISERDKAVITDKFVADIAKKMKIKLTLSTIFGGFLGGVVLSSSNLDKNLSLDLELNLLREEIEPEISKMLDTSVKH